jgi:hypothetical protein
VRREVRVGEDDFVAMAHFSQDFEEIRRNDRRDAFEHDLYFLS